MKENKKKLTQLFQIFTTFMKIGIFTFGGGYAMIPLIQRETVVKRKWVDDDDILDIVAIAESTPGPIAINASTFVGYRVGGFFGVLALIIRALWLMYKNVKKCAVSYIVMAAAFILSAFTSVNVIIVIAGCALFGLITAYINTKKK